MFPAGEFDGLAAGNEVHRKNLIETIEFAPDTLRRALNGLSDAQVETRYRNWTIRQIVHHIADSHMNSYIRFKWALTEDEPTIKAYDESAWIELPDARIAGVGSSLLILEGLHRRWTVLLRAMTNHEFERTFQHPQTGESIRLSLALPYYAWHGRHHTAQIEWVRMNRL